MKKFSVLLALLLFLQACSVYHSESVSVQEAVAADRKVKVITANDQKYKFKRLELEDDRLFGITKLSSATAKKLAGVPAVVKGKYIEMDISSVEIERIRLRDGSSSTILTVATVAASLVVAYFTAFLLYISLSGDFMESEYF